MAKKGNQGPKFTPTQREGVMARVSHMDLQGWSQWDIAAEVGVSQAMVSEYLTTIRKRHRERQVEDRGEKVALLTARYMLVVKEAFAAWHGSKEPGQRETSEQELRVPRREPKANGKGNKDNNNGGQMPSEEDKPRMLLTKVVKVTEGRLPASEYLKIVLECLEAVRNLEGLDAPKQMEVKGQMTVRQGLSLEELLTVANGDPTGEVERMIEGMLREGGRKVVEGKELPQNGLKELNP